MEPTQIVQVRDLLRLWIHSQRWRVLRYLVEHCMCGFQLITLKDNAKTKIGKEVDAYTLAVWLTIDNAGRGPSSVLEAFRKGPSDGIRTTFWKRIASALFPCRTFDLSKQVRIPIKKNSKCRQRPGTFDDGRQNHDPKRSMLESNGTLPKYS